MAHPEHFFKYVDPDTAKIILKNCTLRWSAPSRFNDPFDVQFDLHIKYERGKIVEEALDEMWAIYTQKKEIVVANALGAVLKMLSLKPNIIPHDEFVSALCQPSTWAMLLIGFAGIGFLAYRRKSKPALMAA